jgi:hypothetical protein
MGTDLLAGLQRMLEKGLQLPNSKNLMNSQEFPFPPSKETAEIIIEGGLELSIR